MITKKLLAAWEELMGHEDRIAEFPYNKHAIEEMHSDAQYELAVLGFINERWWDFDHEDKPEDPTAEEALKITRAAIKVMKFGWYRGDLEGNLERRMEDGWR